MISLNLKFFSSKAERVAIVERHNELRARIANGNEENWKDQPKAANMNKLVWNDELAKFAQRHVPSP